MRKSAILTLAVFAILLVPVMAMAGSFEGTIQGISCAVQGKVCPVDAEDPMAAVEKDFVLVTGGTYYILPGLDRAMKARWINMKVRVTGAKSPKYNAISAKKVEVMRGGAWKLAWTPALEAEILDKSGWNLK